MGSDSENTQTREARVRAIIIALVVGLCVGLAVLQTGPRSGGLKPGTIAPAFELRSLDGEAVKLSSFRGRGVVVAFWASWCKPCLRELPAIARLDEETDDAQVSFVTIADDSPSKLKRVLERLRMQGAKANFDVLIDQRGRTHVSYGVHSIPAITFINPDGTVRESWVGETSERRLREEVNAMVEEHFE